ncbi:hypothetical protein GQ600_16032 [Phytophthora cactorum]|nr:hypothetical protein GQ600_16032 [Phytophthora cactorum]
MVRVTRPPNPSYTNAQVAGFYFRPCRDQDDEVILDMCCVSTRLRSVMLEATAAQTGSILNFIRHSSQNLFGWMVWIVQCNLPLSFCEAVTQTFSNLEPISEERLRAGMDGVVMAVERSIASELPQASGLLLDGWTHASEHYVAVFVCYEVNGNLKTPLLSMALLLNEANNDLSAESHLDFLATLLPVTSEYIWYNVSLVGCANHRLNLAVQDDLAVHEDDLAAMQVLMIKLRTLTESAKRRNSTADEVELDLRNAAPTPAANKRLCVLYQELRDIESVSKALQGRDVDLLDVPLWFDELISVKPHYARFIVTAPADARESLEEQQDSFVERLRKCRRLYEERSS